MQTIDSLQNWKEIRAELQNQTIGFVPTMGNLHAGHVSLLQRSKNENAITALSIFINPTQFNNSEDLKNYPQTLAADLKLAKQQKIDYVLLPKYEEIYADNYRYKICEAEQSKKLCGEHRPGHFEGVLTVVMKLLNLVKPNKAYFGEKDFQQLELIEGMVKAFYLETQIIPCPIIRDAQGLALSSRNNRMTQEQYQFALRFPELLQANKDPHEIKKLLEQTGFIVDYVEDYQGRRFGAVKVGDIRLIDNIKIGE